MPQIFSNGARAELDTSITADSVSLTVITGGNLFPVANYAGVDTLTQSSVEDWFKLVLQDDDGYEIVYCYRHDIGSNNFLNLRRGQEGTVARPFATGTIVGLRPLAKDMADLVQSNQENKVSLANKADKTGDISGNAGTATKLESPRAFSISGGVTAAAKNFDGTMPVDLVVTAIDVSKANQGTLTVERGGTGTTTSTGSGNVMLSDSPALTGIPTAPTAALATNTDQVATTAFVQAATDSKVDKVAGKQLSTEDYTSAEKTKLSGIADQATKNATDAALRDRSTHTGTQPASTITGLGTAATRNVGTSDGEVLTVGAGGWLSRSEHNSYMLGYPTTVAENVSQIYRRDTQDGEVASYAASLHFGSADTWGRIRINFANKQAWLQGGQSSSGTGWSSQLLLLDNVLLPITYGGIIERGSNANGEYVRFADGTQICTFSVPSYALNPVLAPGQALLYQWGYRLAAEFVGESFFSVYAELYDSTGNNLYGNVFTCSNAIAFQNMGSRPSETQPPVGNTGTHTATHAVVKGTYIGRWK